MEKPSSMGKFYAQKQKEINNHFEEWREYLIQEFKPWIEKKWISVEKSKLFGSGPNKKEYFFELKISLSPSPLIPNSHHTLYFLENGSVNNVAYLERFDLHAIFAQYLKKRNKESILSTKQTFTSSYILIKDLMMFYDEIETK